MFMSKELEVRIGRVARRMWRACAEALTRDAFIGQEWAQVDNYLL